MEIVTDLTPRHTKFMRSSQEMQGIEAAWGRLGKLADQRSQIRGRARRRAFNWFAVKRHRIRDQFDRAPQGDQATGMRQTWQRDGVNRGNTPNTYCLVEDWQSRLDLQRDCPAQSFLQDRDISEGFNWLRGKLKFLFDGARHRAVAGVEPSLYVDVQQERRLPQAIHKAFNPVNPPGDADGRLLGRRGFIRGVHGV